MRTLGTALVVVTALSCFCLPQAQARVIKGQWRSHSKDFFAKIGSFCFDTLDGGQGKAKLQVDSTTGQYSNISWYYDETSGAGRWNNWHELQKHHWSCATKVAHASESVAVYNDQLFRQPYFDKQRPHFWYWATFCCNCSKAIGYSASYKLTLLNPGNSQFSCEELPLFPISIVFTIFYALLVAEQVLALYAYARTGPWHPLIRLVCLCVVLQFMSFAGHLIHWSAYSHNGIGAPGLRIFSQIFEAAGTLIFMVLCLLVATGFGVSDTKLRQTSELTIVLSAIVVLYSGLTLWLLSEVHSADHADTLSNAPGTMLLVLRMLMLGYFAYSMWRTHSGETHPAHRRFYWRFGLGIACYFIMMSVVPLICTWTTDPWVRPVTLVSVQATANAAAILAVAALLWPQWVTRFFAKIATPTFGDAEDTPSNDVVVVDEQAPLFSTPSRSAILKPADSASAAENAL